VNRKKLWEQVRLGLHIVGVFVFFAIVFFLLWLALKTPIVPVR